MKKVTTALFIIFWLTMCVLVIFELGHIANKETIAKKKNVMPFDLTIQKVEVGVGICDNWEPGDTYARFSGIPPSETGTGRWRIIWVECIQKQQTI